MAGSVVVILSHSPERSSSQGIQIQAGTAVTEFCCCQVQVSTEYCCEIFFFFFSNRAKYNGADDYITKPFRIQELRARVAAHLRREKREHHSTLSFEPDIRFDLSAKVLYVSEQPVPLTKSEYSICEYLAKNRGQVFTKEQIYEAVFGFDGIGDNSTISTHIKNIRAKLEHFKISPVSTVWGIGYKWE